MTCGRGQRGGTPKARAFSLVEAAVSITVAGGLLVVSLGLVGATATGHKNIGDSCQGRMLALGMMSEIMATDYEEPDDPPTFGRESGESGGSRIAYDDVDDYDNWAKSPPETKEGTVMTDLDAWQRNVLVEYVDPDDLTAVSGTDTGVKRITVTVRHNAKVVAEIVAVRTVGM